MKNNDTGYELNEALNSFSELPLFSVGVMGTLEPTLLLEGEGGVQAGQSGSLLKGHAERINHKLSPWQDHF